MREATGAAAGEHDPERAADEPAGEAPRAGVARLRGREPVECAWVDPLDERADRLAGGRSEDDEVGAGERPLGQRAVARRDAQDAVGLPGAQVAPRAGARFVEQEHVGVLVLRSLDATCARGGRVQHLDRAVGLQRIRERGSDRSQRDVRADRGERDQRGSRRPRLEPTARL